MMNRPNCYFWAVVLPNLSGLTCKGVCSRVLALIFLAISSAVSANDFAAYSAWVDSNGLTYNAHELRRVAETADEHGLNPEKYKATMLAGLSPKIHDTETLNKHFDRAFASLANDLGQGVIDARRVQKRYYRTKPSVNTENLLQQLHLGETTVTDIFDDLIPQHDDYRRLVSHMRQLLGERDASAHRTHVEFDGILAEDAVDDSVLAIKRRLRETGHLSHSFAGNHFDSAVSDAVIRFQEDNGLESTGKVGPKTRQALNLSIETEIEKVAMSLERWRWLPRDLGFRHVFVNLPNYRLSMMNGNQEVANMPVVIGKTSHKTPQFTQDLSYLEFMPTWTVPAKITRAELLPLEKKSPGYLRSRGFMFMKYRGDKLQPVSHSQVSQADLNTRPFPYILRQKGGEGNALGRVKFMMPNPYAIYLHDTPAKRLFGNRIRAYSHGCVRVSDPERLASLILQIDGASRDNVKSLWESEHTIQSSLRSPIPTHLTYFTTWIDDAGTLQRRKDVYKQDTALADALRDANTVLSITPANQIAYNIAADRNQR